MYEGVAIDELSDNEVIRRSRTDPEAFTAIVERWSGSLLRFFYRRTFDAQASLDLVAETLAVAFERRSRYVDSGVPASGWLFGIARRELGRYRRRGRIAMRAVARLDIEVPAVGDATAERIAELVDAQAIRGSLVDALATLSEREREAVALRVLEERSYEEVARTLGCSVGAARVRVHRGLRRLSERLEVLP